MHEAERLGREMNPLLSVPARDSKKTTLIVEQGDGTRPGSLDGDEPLPFGPSQGRTGDDVDRGAMRQHEAGHVGREMNPLLSVPARDSKETSLIIERGDGMRPGASDGDEPPSFGLSQGRAGDDVAHGARRRHEAGCLGREMNPLLLVPPRDVKEMP